MGWRDPDEARRVQTTSADDLPFAPTVGWKEEGMEGALVKGWKDGGDQSRRLTREERGFREHHSRGRVKEQE